MSVRRADVPGPPAGAAVPAGVTRCCCPRRGKGPLRCRGFQVSRQGTRSPPPDPLFVLFTAHIIGNGKGAEFEAKRRQMLQGVRHGEHPVVLC